MKIKIKVFPKSSRRMVSEAGGMIKVYVTDPPDKGKANKSVIEILAEKYKVHKRDVIIISGHKSREKTVEVSGL